MKSCGAFLICTGKSPQSFGPEAEMDSFHRETQIKSQDWCSGKSPTLYPTPRSQKKIKQQEKKASRNSKDANEHWLPKTLNQGNQHGETKLQYKKTFRRQWLSPLFKAWVIFTSQVVFLLAGCLMLLCREFWLAFVTIRIQTILQSGRIM